MKRFYRFFVAIFLLISATCTGCSEISSNNSSEDVHNNFSSTLWIQQSAEYKAVTNQTYNIATINLKKVVNDHTVSAFPESNKQNIKLPPAVVLDIDETVLDNSSYTAQLILENTSHDTESWDQWVSYQQAAAIPGAVEFINYAQDIGVEVIYITNRTCRERSGTKGTCPQKADTINNMSQLGIKGIKPEKLLLKNEQPEWESEKDGRRLQVSKRYRIVMLIGDDLGDFLPNVRKFTPDQLAKLISTHMDKWGHVWYILPNPNYGSWWNVLESPRSKYLIGY